MDQLHSGVKYDCLLRDSEVMLGNGRYRSFTFFCCMFVK